MLSAEEAERFYEDGYLVLRAAVLGSHGRAARALREMNLVLAELARVGYEKGCVGPGFGLVEDKKRDGLNSVRVESRKEFAALLGPLRRIIEQLLGGRPEQPKSCQLAYAPPIGSLGEDFKGRSDSRAGDEYHIDGRGRIPNGFALLVGVALSSPPPGSCSWGALTVFPGSHRNTALHTAYSKQKSQSGKHMNLGTPKHVTLERGDVVLAHSLLAHRRSQNWSEEWRYQVYWRLRPERARSDPRWESGLPMDPWAVLPGVLEQRASGRVEDAPPLSEEEAQSVFREFPAVEELYQTQVPSPLSPAQFWKRCLSSRYYLEAMGKDIGQGQPFDSMFDTLERPPPRTSLVTPMALAP